MNPAVNPDPEEGQETVDAEVLPIRLFLIYYPLTLNPKALHFYCPGEESAPKTPLWKDHVAVFNDSKLIYNLENDEEETEAYKFNSDKSALLERPHYRHGPAERPRDVDWRVWDLQPAKNLLEHKTYPGKAKEEDCLNYLLNTHDFNEESDQKPDGPCLKEPLDKPLSNLYPRKYKFE